MHALLLIAVAWTDPATGPYTLQYRVKKANGEDGGLRSYSVVKTAGPAAAESIAPGRD